MLDLNEIVSGINKLLRRVIGEDIRLNVSFSREPAWIIADITNIEQIIMNLVTNARDAMPQGGELTIAIEVKEIDDELRKAHNVPDIVKFVVLEVEDTGRGIDREILDRIFDPFFTTKEVGKGTGLGLSIVYSIVTQHGGFIEVRSVKDKGTVFEIYFPYQEDGEKTDLQSQEEMFLEGGNETILLVEDDVDIRNSLKFILERYGYNVIEASNGIEGLEMFSKRKDEIDLIISDVVMPGMSGVKMFEGISAIKRNVQIIFMSGYNEEVLEQRGNKNIDVLFKPIPPAQLLKMIRQKLKNV